MNKADRRFDIFFSDSSSYHISDTIVVQETGNQYCIISGFEILNEQLDVDYRFPALFLHQDASMVDTLTVLVDIHQKRRPFLPIEVARIFQIAKERNITDADLSGKILPLINFKINRDDIDRYLKFLLLEDFLIRFLVDKNAPAKTWFLTSTFDTTGQKNFLDLVNLRPTLSTYEEILRYLQEIQKRENQDLEILLQQLKWKAILYNADSESKERIGEIRNAILNRRFPLLSSHQKSIMQLVATIPLPGNAEIRYDDTFEKKELQIHWHLNSAEEIRKMRDFYSENNIRKIQQLLDTL